MLYVKLADGRLIAHPLAWYPWLAGATDEQFTERQANPLLIYWPKLEDVFSLDTLLTGPAPKK
jgi:hypothetical protein